MNYKMDYLSNIATHLEALQKIVKDSGEPFEGNCFYYHLTFNTDESFSNKHMNIMDVARNGNQILEIGFNAGHSALLMLVANPECHIHSFDICDHSYTVPCMNYLNQQFGNRITLHAGDSHQTLKAFAQEHPDHKFDVLHIDGCHEYLHANVDFFLSKDLARPGSWCILDDTNLPGIKSLWEGYVRDGHIQEIPMRDATPHQHSIGLYL